MTTWTSRNIAVVTTILFCFFFWHQQVLSLCCFSGVVLKPCYRKEKSVQPRSREREWNIWGFVAWRFNHYYFLECQMAVSQNTVFCVGYGGGRIFLVPLLFPQLERTDALSCLHWFCSWCLSSIRSESGGLSRYLCSCGCCRERISLHSVRFLSIWSSIVVSPHIHGIWNIWRKEKIY